MNGVVQYVIPDLCIKYAKLWLLLTGWNGRRTALNCHQNLEKFRDQFKRPWKVYQSLWSPWSSGVSWLIRMAWCPSWWLKRMSGHLRLPMWVPKRAALCEHKINSKSMVTVVNLPSLEGWALAPLYVGSKKSCPRRPQNFPKCVVTVVNLPSLKGWAFAGH